MYFAVEEQFMVGPSLLITPVLHEGKAAVTGYFPSSGQTTWRDWITGEVSISIHHPKLQGIFIDDQVVKPNSKGQAELLTPLGKINVHIRAGSVILIHDKPAYSLTETRESPYGLVIHLDAKGEAKSEAVLDDGLSIDGRSLNLVQVTARDAYIRSGDIYKLHGLRQEAQGLF
jgi:alpha-glucosidase